MKNISVEQKELLERLLTETKTKENFRRVQCVWLRVALSMSSIAVATAVGLKVSTVRMVQSHYFRYGESSLLGRGRGGRRHENLSKEEEKKLLVNFLEKAERGGILVVSEIKSAYEKVIGHVVPKSTIYRMLARHGWRKITPRSHHPLVSYEDQEEFKKKLFLL